MKDNATPARLPVEVSQDSEALARSAAEKFMNEAIGAVRDKGSFHVALSGGSTPKPLYSLLATDPVFRQGIPWEQIEFFWSDERQVPPNHPDSNYRMACESLLSKVPVPADHIHRMRAQLPDARQTAEEYEHTLRYSFQIAYGEVPRFDLILLGMGTDGHTASLFPGTEALEERERLAVANWVNKLNAWRITLTFPVLNSAASVLFLVSGTEKAEILRQVLQGPANPPRYPAQMVQPVNGRLLWLVDSAAASLLES